MKALLDEESAHIREAHFAGANGNEIVQRRTTLIDRLLREAHADVSAAGPLPALLAIGGYGRGELNPHSDIDLMFLCGDDADRSRAPELLYLLWDAGMDIGYSVRSAKECVSLARQDPKIRTSLIESRLIAGDRTLYDAFRKSMNEDVFYWKSSQFITSKIAERNAARVKYGGSLYLREPNIKEGAGGLRDFHTALWVAFVHFRVPSLPDLVRIGVLSDKQYGIFIRSRNFFWRVRNEIHYLSDRKNDQLTFDLQERVASDFRYRDSGNLLAVERFMKSYFLHARNIREFSSHITDAVLKKPARGWFSRALTIGPFSLIGRVLVPSTDDLIRNDPAQIMRAFEIMQSRHAALSDRLKATIRGQRISDEIRSSLEVSTTFCAILNNPEGLFETLTLMKDLRFLGRYLPEFRDIQSLAKHDHYHMYTVDEHSLIAIQNIQALWAGRFPGLTTLYNAFHGLKKRWVLMLTILLHDLGKVYRYGHEHRGLALAEKILARLHIADEDRSRILFLIGNHLVMTTLSQRRELNDRKVIADFAKLVQDRENLVMLYLLTYADVSAVNPTAWTQWRAVLLQELYVRTLDYFEENVRASDEVQARLEAARSRIVAAAEKRYSREDVDAFLGEMPEQYLLYTSPVKVVDHLGMMKRLPEEKLVISHRHYQDRGYTELTVCAYDAYGMFYRTAGTLAAKNLNILRAKVHTSRNGVMIDTFQITDPDGVICVYEEAWARVLTDLRDSLMSGKRPPEPGLYQVNRNLPAPITPSVEFDNDASESFTIIDVTGRDRIGFLYHITKTLYDLNLDIGSAKIVTEGSRVLDSFYVTDLFRQKIVDQLRLDKIRSALLKVIEQ